MFHLAEEEVEIYVGMVISSMTRNSEKLTLLHPLPLYFDLCAHDDSRYATMRGLRSPRQCSRGWTGGAL